MAGWIVDIFGVLIFWVGIPGIFIISAIAPFIVVKKLFKRRFTAPNVLASLVASVALLAFDLYALNLGIKWLAGAAFCGIYGC